MDLVKKRSEENLYEAASDARRNDNRERRKSNKESAGSVCVAQRRLQTRRRGGNLDRYNRDIYPLGPFAGYGQHRQRGSSSGRQRCTVKLFLKGAKEARPINCVSPFTMSVLTGESVCSNGANAAFSARILGRQATGQP